MKSADAADEPNTGQTADPTASRAVDRAAATGARDAGLGADRAVVPDADRAAATGARVAGLGADWGADLAAALDRRPEPRGRVRPIARPHLEDLWARPDIAPRERALWLLLYESAAPAEWALSLDVQDLDLPGMSAVVRGRRRRIRWEAGTAALLPPLVGDRRRGPLFLTDRRPGPGRAPAAAGLCPHTGRSRLSYERAEHLFKRATRDLDPLGEGYTLHRLRHSRLAHLAEDGWTAPMLMSLSGHTSARTLREFVRAGQPAEVTAGPPCPPAERPRTPTRPTA
ncbi:site-specific integrase [Microbispora cellulosiformans]|uniref:Site-specific integrase n=1 Tax=Microbispora cellulosiformans TaxID=2614688 RepID=A0A5J5JT27_9ACTN|nr:site-specific integrase [Microbispora cellulosiformans]